MNRRQLEVQKAHAQDETEMIRQLKKVYEQAKGDCEAKIRMLSARTDMENLQSIVWQAQYQEALKSQLEGILDILNAGSFTTIADYLTASYENGFFGTLYDLQGQGIPLIFPINQEEAVKALQTDTKLSQGYYQKLGEDTVHLKESIRTELSRGAANGESWNRMAVQITKGMNSPFNKAYNNALRIARTEGHRVQQEAAYHCQQRAKSKGADVVKQWDSTLDGLTRPHHVELDGQVRELDVPFEVAGYTAMYPGGFGVASEDIHCRCLLLQRARWALTEEEYYTKWDGDKNELVRVKAKTYNEFKAKADEIIKKPKEETGVHLVGKVNKKIFKCVTTGIVTDEVIITDERIRHIEERHPGDYERYQQYMADMISNPDYIIRDDRPLTAMVLKAFIDVDTSKHFRLALRFTAPEEGKDLKNSIITFMKIREKEYKRLVKNKQVLYKKD